MTLLAAEGKRGFWFDPQSRTLGNILLMTITPHQTGAEALYTPGSPSKVREETAEMENLGAHISRYGLDRQGVESSGSAYWNLPPARLYEEALKRGEAVLAAEGPLVARTGEHTGRSPHDRFLVRGEAEAESIWWGKVNRPFERSRFNAVRDRLLAHIRENHL